MSRRVAVLVAGLALALLASRGRGAGGAARQHRAPGLPGRHGRSAGAVGPHDVPAGAGAAGRRAVDLRRPPGRRRLQGARRRRLRPGDQHLRPGRLQRRRPRARGRRLPAPLAPDGRRREPAARLCAAARAHLPADRVGAERRQRRAVDAARRHAAPERRSRSSCPTRPTATRPTGSPAPCGRWARAIGRSAPTTRPSRASCAAGSSWRSGRSTARCSTPIPAPRSSTGGACRPG